MSDHLYSRRVGIVLALSASLGLAGCAQGGGALAGAGFSSGGSCASMRKEMNRLVSRGVVSKSEAAASGRSLSKSARADVDRYSQLLESYLGRGCEKS